MMGFGSFGNGGGGGGPSSASNLSALAPPFTVDRSFPKPNSNPLVNFNELPYSSSIPNWWDSSSQSPTPIPDYYGKNPNLEVDSISMTLPTVNNNRYLVPIPQSIGSPNVHMPPPLNAVGDGASAMDASATTGVFTFGQSSMDTNVDEAKSRPYYQPYVLPVRPEEDNHLMALNDSAVYDFLPTSHVAHSSGTSHVAHSSGTSHVALSSGTSQDDYTKSFSGMESSIRWDGSWNGLRDLESGRQTDFSWNFSSKETNAAHPSIYPDYVPPGRGFLKSSSAFEDTLAASYNFDMQGRKKYTGCYDTKQSDGKSFISQDFGCIPTSGTSVLGLWSTSLSTGIHSQETTLESIPSSSSIREPYNVKYENCFRQHDPFLSDFISVKKSAPAFDIRLPAMGTCSSAPNSLSSKNVNFIDIDVAGNHEDFARNILSNFNDPCLTLCSEGNEVCTNPSRLGFYMERNDQYVADAFSGKTEVLSSNKSVTKNAFDHLFKARSEPQHTPTSSPDGFSLALNEAKAIDSVENSSKSLDQYNPSEDSPCWKGATASRFSPFEVSEALVPQQFKEEIDAGSVSSPHVSQIFPFYTDDGVRVHSQKLSEKVCYENNGSMENGLSPSVTRPSLATYSNGEHKLGISPKAGSSTSGVQFSNSAQKTRKQFALPNNSKFDSDRPSNTMVPSFQEVSFTSEECASESHVAKTWMNGYDASENGPLYVPIPDTDAGSGSPCGDNAPSKLTTLLGAESIQKDDVPVVIKSMHKLSDLLLCYSSNDACALKEQDQAALKHVINKLNACLLKNDEKMTSARDSAFSLEDTSHLLRESPDLHQGVSVDRSNVKKGVAANAMDKHKHQFGYEEKKPNIMLGREDEKFPDFISKRNDAEDIVKTDEMSKAIKTILAENFQGEEETHPQALLYKNLWLEAEAVLCSTNYRARFDRMKNKMERCKPHEEIVVSEDSMDEENLSKSKVYPNIIMVNKLASESKSGIQDSPIINKTTHADDILARFHILKCRADNSSSMTIDTVKVSDSNVVPDLNKIDKSAPQAYDGPDSDINVEGSPISSIPSHEDNVEDSVMARFFILKSRPDNSISMDEAGGQQPAGIVDLGFLAEPEHTPIKREELKDGTFNMTVGRDLQHHIDDCTEDKLTVKNPCSDRDDDDDGDDDDDDDDDILFESSGTDGIEDQQHPPCWYDSSSLDWEHVVKDNFVWHPK